MNADAKRQINMESGYDNLIGTLRETGLHSPFIPKALHLNVSSQGKWCWGTDRVDSFRMYLMDNQYLHELITEDAPDYMALSHAGHGINSYGLQYALRYGPLVLFFQSSFGGAYNDHKEDVIFINTAFNHINGLIDTMPTDIAKKSYSKRIVLIWSNFRDACNYGTLNLHDLQSREHKSDVLSDIPWKFIPDPNQLFKEIGKELTKLVGDAQ